MKSSKKTVIGKVILPILVTPAMIILLTEIYLRCTCRQKLARWNESEFIADTVLGYRYKADTTFTCSNTAFTNICKTNIYGFPGSNFEKKKQKGTYRIIIVGSSDETGFQSDGAYSYPQRLQDFFKAKNYPVEIINCSTAGWNRAVRNINLIKNECIHYDPDMILFMNEMPIVDNMRYRETYKGYTFATPDINKMDAFKKKIDNLTARKNGWFKLYDLSYIFRYYMKIYIDYIKDQKHKHKFVLFTRKILSQNVIDDMGLYVRKREWDAPPYVNVELFDGYPDWDETNVTWNTLPKINYMVKTLYSGEYEQSWAETDITAYLRRKITEQLQYISLVFSIQPYKKNEKKHISFVSKKIRNFSPVLHIKGDKDGKTAEFILYPVEDGYVKNNIYCNNNFEVFDSVIHVGNKSTHNTDSIKGLLKFDISSLKNIEKATLKLFVVKLEVGNLYPGRRYTFSESADTLKSLQTFLEKRNIRFALFNTYKGSLKYAKSFARREINYIHLDIPRKEKYSFGALDGHSTQAGHQAIAEAFFGALVNGIIPEQFLSYPGGKK